MTQVNWCVIKDSNAKIKMSLSILKYFFELRYYGSFFRRYIVLVVVLVVYVKIMILSLLNFVNLYFLCESCVVHVSCQPQSGPELDKYPVRESSVDKMRL